MGWNGSWFVDVIFGWGRWVVDDGCDFIGGFVGGWWVRVDCGFLFWKVIWGWLRRSVCICNGMRSNWEFVGVG